VATRRAGPPPEWCRNAGPCDYAVMSRPSTRWTARTFEAILAGETWCAARPAVTVGTVSLADAWEHHATDWIAWARAPDHDAFWEGLVRPVSSG
jgi:hypothetical protein